MPQMIQIAHRFHVPIPTLYESLSYLILCLLNRFEAISISKIIDLAWKNQFGHKLPTDLREIILDPAIALLEVELYDICLTDCHRVRTKTRVLNDKQVQTYWERLRVHEPQPELNDQGVCNMEFFEIGCNIGFQVSKKKNCPFAPNPKRELLGNLGSIAKKRFTLDTTNM